MTIMELFERFPDDEVARRWFEELRWPNGAREFPHCGGVDTREVKNARRQPYQCCGCKKFFSAKVGSIMQGSRLKSDKRQKTSPITFEDS